MKFSVALQAGLGGDPEEIQGFGSRMEKYISDVSQQSSLVESGGRFLLRSRRFTLHRLGGGVAIAAKILSSFKGGISSGVATKMAGRWEGRSAPKSPQRPAAK